jgi:hypothetical protein
MGWEPQPANAKSSGCNGLEPLLREVYFPGTSAVPLAIGNLPDSSNLMPLFCKLLHNHSPFTTVLRVIEVQTR